MPLFQNHQTSPRSTPNSSPRSTKSPPLPPGAVAQSGPRSAPQTPLGVAPNVNQQIGNCGPVNQSERSQYMQHPPLQPIRSREEMGLSNIGMERNERTLHNNDSLVGVGGDVRNAFGNTSNVNMGKASS